MAREIELGDHLYLGRGELASGGRDKESILADAMEAVIAALYLDQGFEGARRFILERWADRIDARVAAPGKRDYKTRLQEVLAQVGSAAPLPDHRRRSRPRQDLHGGRRSQRRHCRRGHGTVQEGSRAECSGSRSRERIGLNSFYDVGVESFNELDAAWQLALAQAWRAHVLGNIGVGAVLTDRTGFIVGKGRNRVVDTSAPPGRLHGNYLAHAEMDVLAQLPAGDYEHHTLWTTLEPCLLCLSAIVTSHVGAVRFAAPDPLWDGLEELRGINAQVDKRWPRRIGPLTGRWRASVQRFPWSGSSGTRASRRQLARTSPSTPVSSPWRGGWRERARWTRLVGNLSRRSSSICGPTWPGRGSSRLRHPACARPPGRLPGMHGLRSDGWLPPRLCLPRLGLRRGCRR